MSSAVCPTEIVDTPVEVVWGLLTNAAQWGDFFDVRITGLDPAGPAVIGQRVLGESGPRLLHLKISFEYTRVSPSDYRLGLTVRLPFAVTVHEELDCAPIDAQRCRVNYHCNFEFPRGWRGWVARVLLRRETERGPVDSLSRLKRAAEKHYAAANRRS